MGRVFPLGAGTWFPVPPTWLPILIFLALLAGLAAWTAQEHDRLALLSSSRATWLWLILALTPVASSHDALGWGLAGLVLGLILLAVGQTQSTSSGAGGRRWPWPWSHWPGCR